MQPKRADKILLSSIRKDPKASPTSPDGPEANGSRQSVGPTDRSPYRQPRGARPKPAKRPTESAPRWQSKENILQAVAALGRFETLGRALQSSGLTATLALNGPYTLFAPTDKAFAKLDSADLDALLNDSVRLHELLSYHVVPGKVKAPRRNLPRSATTLGGTALEIAVVPEDGGYRVDDSRIVKTNIRASNGVIHAIDTVLTPR
jgi:uncharacterized surface protein with fasciclin (FAS1) repeats